MASGFGFFDPLIEWQAKAWNASKAAYTLVFNWLKAGYAWIVGLVYAFLVISDRVINMVVDMIRKLAELGGAMSVPDPVAQNTGAWGEGVFEMLQICNYFFPVDECLTLTATCSILFMACTGYRAVKSWIPTLS